jgi:uncharacterized protein
MLRTMQLELDKSDGVVIRSFDEGELHINDLVVTTHVIVTPEEIIGEWSPPSIDEIGIADFQAALDLNPEVILFGTGMQQRFPAGELITEILRKGIGFEIMDTRAACRTFNVLTSEYRRVVAALLVR